MWDLSEGDSCTSTTKGHHMATRDLTRDGNAARTITDNRRNGTVRRLATETKSFFKTSEFWAYLVVLAGILIAGNSIENAEGGRDFFTADKVWLYATILTVGYMVSRGIAKAGVRDPYWADRGDPNADH
jgi:hypothetical protein